MKLHTAMHFGPDPNYILLRLSLRHCSNTHHSTDIGYLSSLSWPMIWCVLQWHASLLLWLLKGIKCRKNDMSKKGIENMKLIYDSCKNHKRTQGMVKLPTKNSLESLSIFIPQESWFEHSSIMYYSFLNSYWKLSLSLSHLCNLWMLLYILLSFSYRPNF